MKAWIVVLLAALMVAALALVAILLRGVIPQRPAPPPVVQGAPNPPLAPAVAEVPAVDVRSEVARLLELLKETVKSGDSMRKGEIQDQLRALGLPAVAPMREDVLGNGGRWLHSIKLHEAIRDTLLGMASPEVGAELLKSWIELDEGKHPFDAATAGPKLGYFADVVVKSPPTDARKRILEMFAKAERQTIKKSLIELMGRLLGRFPGFKDDLLGIMKDDADVKLRSEAALALGSADARAVLPEVTARLAAILGDSKYYEHEVVDSLVRTILKAVPIDEALVLLRKEVGDGMEEHQAGELNMIGLAVGWACGAPGDPDLEVVLSHAVPERSPGMQLVYLGALGYAQLKQNADGRLTDLAVTYLDSSTNETVRSTALGMITAFERDEATVLSSCDKAWKSGSNLAAQAAVYLKFYADRNAHSAAAVEKLGVYVTTGSVETRMRVIHGLQAGGTKIPQPVLDQLKTIARSDPEQKIRDEALKTLKWAGVPLD